MGSLVGYEGQKVKFRHQSSSVWELDDGGWRTTCRGLDFTALSSNPAYLIFIQYSFWLALCSETSVPASASRGQGQEGAREHGEAFPKQI